MLLTRVCSCLLLITGQLRAQSTSAFHPLEIPKDSVMRCHAARLDRGSSGVISVNLELGRPEIASRSLEAWFDSAGRPLKLTETILQSGADGPTLEGTTVAFKTDAAAEGFRTHHSMNTTNGKATGTARPLTNDELRDARSLSDWMWRRTCRGNAHKYPERSSGI